MTISFNQVPSNTKVPGSYIEVDNSNATGGLATDEHILLVIGQRTSTGTVEAEEVTDVFSAEQGGILCPTCGRVTGAARPVTMNALKYLRHFQRSSYQEAKRAVIPATIHSEMEILMQHYLTYLLERNLNTPSFQRRIQKGEAIDLGTPKE